MAKAGSVTGVRVWRIRPATTAELDTLDNCERGAGKIILAAEQFNRVSGKRLQGGGLIAVAFDTDGNGDAMRFDSPLLATDPHKWSVWRAKTPFIINGAELRLYGDIVTRHGGVYMHQDSVIGSTITDAARNSLQELGGAILEYAQTHHLAEWRDRQALGAVRSARDAVMEAQRNLDAAREQERAAVAALEALRAGDTTNTVEAV